MALAQVALAVWTLSSASETLRAPNVPVAERQIVRLVWYDGERLLPHGFERMADEVERIFRPMGLDVSWSEGAPRETTYDVVPPGDLTLKVLLLPVEPGRWGLNDDVMGVVMGNEVPRGVVYLFFNNVVRTLGYRPRPGIMSSPKQTAQVARALGRVLAHEMVHAIAPAHPHDIDGLMSCQLTRAFLISPRVELDPRTVAVLGSELRGLLSADRRRDLPGGRGFLAPFRPKS